ncbi:Ig-like domain-containing protein, partial [Aeromonas jandaei]|uniref:Ig-like domain-containing protein n=1 Tax=Aeromonas jandaei TaxID=650 RepID=UPI003EC5FB63
FVADSGTAVIADEASDFVVDTGAVANGTASNAVRAVVTDARGNLVPDVDVTFAVAGEARFGGMEGAQTVTVRTDANGVASTELVSQVAGDNQVTAQVGSVTTVAKVSRFVADITTARVVDGDFEVIRNNALPNGVATNTALLRVTDARGNPVSGAPVSFAVNVAHASVTTGGLGTTGITGERGMLTANITSTETGEVILTATLNDVDYDLVVNFSSPSIADGDLRVELDGAVADGEAANIVHAIVTDSDGIPVGGEDVTFAANNGGVVNAGNVTVTTGVDGIAIANITNINSGITVVRATVRGITRNVITNFVADSGTAVIADEASDFVVDTGAVANGTASNAVRAVVTDARGNLVPDVDVTFAVAGEARFGGMEGAQTVTVRTDVNGVASTELVSQVAGDNQVTAQVGTQDPTVAKSSDFVSDMSSVTVATTHVSGPLYSEVAVPGLHPDGTDATTPIVGSVWQAQLACTSAVLPADCDAARFDFDWRLRIGETEREVAGTNGNASYIVERRDQGGQLVVTVTPKTESEQVNP